MCSRLAKHWCPDITPRAYLQSGILLYQTLSPAHPEPLPGPKTLCIIRVDLYKITIQTSYRGSANTAPLYGIGHPAITPLVAYTSQNIPSQFKCWRSHTGTRVLSSLMPSRSTTVTQVSRRESPKTRSQNRAVVRNCGLRTNSEEPASHRAHRDAALSWCMPLPICQY